MSDLISILIAAVRRKTGGGNKEECVCVKFPLGGETNVTLNVDMGSGKWVAAFESHEERGRRLCSKKKYDKYSSRMAGGRKKFHSLYSSAHG